MSVSTRLILWGLLGVSMVSVVALSYRHYTTLLDTNSRLESEVATLSTDLTAEKTRTEALSLAIKSWDKAAEKQVKALTDLGTAQREANEYSRSLLNVLSTHELGKLASKKPGLVERRVNSGSSAVIRMFEQATDPAASPASRANVPKASVPSGNKPTPP